MYTRLGTVMIEIHLRSGIIGNVQIIDGYNFCLSRLEEQRLVSLLQGSVESDDSSESGGDGEEGDKAQVKGVGLEVLQPDMSSDNLFIKPGKANSGLDAEKLLICRTSGLHHLIFVPHGKQVVCYW